MKQTSTRPAIEASHSGDERHVVYRCFNAEGGLLYVGISRRAATRITQHSKTKAWWQDCVDIKFTDYPTREAAAQAEIEAIKAERPQHNVLHNSQPGDGMAPEGDYDWIERDGLLDPQDVVLLRLTNGRLLQGVVRFSSDEWVRLTCYDGVGYGGHDEAVRASAIESVVFADIVESDDGRLVVLDNHFERYIRAWG